MAQTGTVRRGSWGATLSRSHCEHSALTTPQMTFGLNPFSPIRWALLMMTRNIGPVVTPAALNQVSTAAFTQVGSGSVRTWPHVAARAHHIGDYPMLFSLLEAFERQSSHLCSSKAASHQDGNHSIISFAADTALVEPGKEALALFRGHPVAHPHTMLFHFLNPPAPPQDQDSEARNRQPRMPAGGPPPSGG
jgi:hypothetical protein